MLPKTLVSCLLLLALLGPARAEDKPAPAIGKVQEYRNHVLCKAGAIFAAYDFIKALRENKPFEEALAAAGPDCRLEERIDLLTVELVGQPTTYVREGTDKGVTIFRTVEVDTKRELLLIHSVELNGVS